MDRRFEDFMWSFEYYGFDKEKWFEIDGYELEHITQSSICKKIMETDLDPTDININCWLEFFADNGIAML